MKSWFKVKLRNTYYFLKGYDIDRFSAPVFVINEIEDIYKVQELSKKQLVNFIVPACKCTWAGGFRYTPVSHPFVKAMISNDTKEVLKNFYENYTPQNLFDLYFLDQYETNNPSIKQPPWKRVKIKKKIGEGGIPNSEGSQHYGPVSDRKLDFETKRCASLFRSMKENGYWPQKYGGFPEGYFIVSEDDFVYQISHLGQHRTAALAATGWEWIEFSSWGREVNIVNKDHVNEWPAVQQGYINYEDAKKVFNRHLSNDLYLTHKDFIKKL